MMDCEEPASGVETPSKDTLSHTPSSSPSTHCTEPELTPNRLAEKLNAAARERGRAALLARELKRKSATVTPSPVGGLSEEDEDLPDNDPFADLRADIERDTKRIEDGPNSGTESLTSRNGKKPRVSRQSERQTSRQQAIADQKVASKAIHMTTKISNSLGDSGKFSFDRLRSDSEKMRLERKKTSDLHDRLEDISAYIDDDDDDDAPPLSTADLETQGVNALSRSPSKRLYKRRSDLLDAMNDIQQGTALRKGTGAHKEDVEAAVHAVKVDYGHNETEEQYEKRMTDRRKRYFWAGGGLDEDQTIAALSLPSCPSNASAPLRVLYDYAQEAISRPKDFPVCSLSALPGELSREDALTALPWYFDLLSHPAVSDAAHLAICSPAKQLLSHISGSHGRGNVPTKSVPLPITFDQIRDTFERLGALPSNRSEMHVYEATLEIGPSLSQLSNKIRFSGEIRAACTIRLLKLCEDLATVHAWSDAAKHFGKVVMLLLHLALDPSSGIFARNLSATLRALFDALERVGSDTCRRLYLDIMAEFGEERSMPLNIRRCVIDFLPVRTELQAQGRRWVAWTFLTNVATEDLDAKQANFLESPPWDEVLPLVDSSNRQSPFYLRLGKMVNPSAFFEAACILSHIASNMSEQLSLQNGKSSKGLSGDLRKLAGQLGRIHNHMRPDLRKDDPICLRAQQAIVMLRMLLEVQAPSKVSAQMTIDEFF